MGDMKALRSIKIFLFAILLLCGCGAGASSSPTASPKATAVVRGVPDEKALKSSSVSLVLNGETENYSLWALGIRLAQDGSLTADEEAVASFVASYCAAHEALPAVANALDRTVLSRFTNKRRVGGEARVRPAALTEKIEALTEPEAVLYILVDTAPKTRAEAVDAAASEVLLASYTTSFEGSSLGKSNRVHNICLAAERINGVVVAPNEVFSMNDTIGDRNRANGWKKAAAISGGNYTQEYGGGVCQVSSTLFNAVLMADLTVVERYHHSWPMPYVPIGRDATISTGKKDFRFKNSSGAAVTIVATVDEENSSLTVALYGIKSGAYDHIELESEKTGYLPAAEDKLLLDESLPQGTREVERKAHRGKTSVTYKLYYAADGTLQKRVLAFRDSYPSIGAIIYVSVDLYD